MCTLDIVQVDDIISHSLLWRHILCWRSVFIQVPRMLYTIVISITKRLQKSVRPFVRRFITLIKMPTLPSLLTVE